jgi:hypothetical protein
VNNREKLPRKELDDLLDYIYENGASSEGIDSLAMKLCDAVRNAALAEVMALYKRDGEMHERHPTIEDAISRFRGIQ